MVYCSDWGYFSWSWMRGHSWKVNEQDHVWSDTGVPSGSLGENFCLCQAVEFAHAWVHVPWKLLVRHFGASGAGLPRLLSQVCVPCIPLDPPMALKSCWKSWEISTVMSPRANISAMRLVLAGSHAICLGIFLLAREYWPFLWVKCPAFELLSLFSQSWHCLVGHQCFLARSLCFKYYGQLGHCSNYLCANCCLLCFKESILESPSHKKKVSRGQTSIVT